MWKLHLLLKDTYRENVMEMLENFTPELLVKALKIMYKRIPNDMVSSLLIGLEKQAYFSFEEFLKMGR